MQRARLYRTVCGREGGGGGGSLIYVVAKHRDAKLICAPWLLSPGDVHLHEVLVPTDVMVIWDEEEKKHARVFRDFHCVFPPDG